MSSNGQVLAGMMEQAYLEVIPTKTIVDRLVHRFQVPWPWLALADGGRQAGASLQRRLSIRPG